MKLLGLLLVVLLLAGCVAPPAPLPRALPGYVQYIPLAVRSGAFGRGGALTHSDIAGCADAQRLNAYWAYNWTPEGIDCYDIASLPMTWTLDPTICPVLGPGNPILNLNEPSNTGAWGTVITPELGSALTRKLTLCYPGRQLATPAEFGGQSGADTTLWLTAWWDDYIAKYGEPPAEIMATHCYAGAAQACITSLTRDIAWATARNLPVLITEWGIVPRWAGSSEKALAEADVLLHWIRAQPEITGEAFFATRIQGDEAWWFKGPTTATIDMQTGELTDWGMWYTQ